MIYVLDDGQRKPFYKGSHYAEAPNDYFVERSNGPTLALKGATVLAHTKLDTSWSHYQHYLFKTASGKFVCVKDDNGTTTAAVVESLNGVYAFFGYGGFARGVYAAAKIEPVETVA